MTSQLALEMLMFLKSVALDGAKIAARARRIHLEHFILAMAIKH